MLRLGSARTVDANIEPIVLSNVEGAGKCEPTILNYDLLVLCKKPVSSPTSSTIMLP